MSSIDEEYKLLKRAKFECKLDHLHGLELLYDKIKLNRSALYLEGKLQNENHAMADKSFQAELLRVKGQMDVLRNEITDEIVTDGI